MWIDDQVLRHYRKPIHSEIFIPSSTMVVLGSGNDENLEVNLEACSVDEIPVLRRYGGGGTVVLYPGCVVVSGGCWVKEQFQNSLYFDLLNRSVIEALSSHWPILAGLSQAGISDIMFEGRKIAGTSMFRSRNYLLYQASILVDLDRDLVGRVLKHPTKEPDYRKGRNHKDFLTSIREITPDKVSPVDVFNILSSRFQSEATRVLDGHLVDPIDSQMSALGARLERSSKES